MVYPNPRKAKRLTPAPISGAIAKALLHVADAVEALEVGPVIWDHALGAVLGVPPSWT